MAKDDSVWIVFGSSTGFIKVYSTEKKAKKKTLKLDQPKDKSKKFEDFWYEEHRLDED